MKDKIFPKKRLISTWRREVQTQHVIHSGLDHTFLTVLKVIRKKSAKWADGHVSEFHPSVARVLAENLRSSERWAQRCDWLSRSINFLSGRPSLQPGGSFILVPLSVSRNEEVSRRFGDYSINYYYKSQIFAPSLQSPSSRWFHLFSSFILLLLLWDRMTCNSFGLLMKRNVSQNPERERISSLIPMSCNFNPLSFGLIIR